ncbi:hypothetical protein [Parerythrobacter lacustris]|uniref:Uncharacterized protein n=1 Tax=Parerythrobacter lacustris TaxID=2969984 RepID=A0ABT1XMS0_9SPHN|nr:hypothetical protein [Parerythrobacter lacustris]MCR2832960.1 hypothetical protein [Parerythrobacter lacustris]
MNSAQIDQLREVAQTAITNFSRNDVISAVKAGAWTRRDYQALLLTIFPQVYQGTMSFALATGNCATRYTALREIPTKHSSLQSRAKG